MTTSPKYESLEEDLVFISDNTLTFNIKDSEQFKNFALYFDNSRIKTIVNPIKEEWDLLNSQLQRLSEENLVSDNESVYFEKLTIATRTFSKNELSPIIPDIEECKKLG